MNKNTLVHVVPAHSVTGKALGIWGLFTNLILLTLYNHYFIMMPIL